MHPIQLLVILAGVLIAILIVDQVYRRRRARVIAALGDDFRMNYSPLDRFALTERLTLSPQWIMRASDLTVKDVLYTTQAGMRCFVATVKCRWSLDQDPSRFVVRILERADHQSEFELRATASDHASGDIELYRQLILDWSADPTAHSALTRS